MNEYIEELKVKLNKKLENYEIDKKFGQLSVDSIYSMFPNEIEMLLNYINQLETCYCNRTDCSARIKDSKKYDSVQQRIDKAIKYIKENEKEYGSLEENEKIILEILRGTKDETN